MIRKFRDPGAAIRTCARYLHTILFSGKDSEGYFWAIGRIYKDNIGFYYASLHVKGGFKIITEEEMKGI